MEDVPCLQDFVSENLGQRFIEPQVSVKYQLCCLKKDILTCREIFVRFFCHNIITNYLITESEIVTGKSQTEAAIARSIR